MTNFSNIGRYWPLLQPWRTQNCCQRPVCRRETGGQPARRILHRPGWGVARGLGSGRWRLGRTHAKRRPTWGRLAPLWPLSRKHRASWMCSSLATMDVCMCLGLWAWSLGTGRWRSPRPIAPLLAATSWRQRKSRPDRCFLRGHGWRGARDLGCGYWWLRRVDACLASGLRQRRQQAGDGETDRQSAQPFLQGH